MIASPVRCALVDVWVCARPTTTAEGAARALAGQDPLIAELARRFGPPRLHRGAFDPGREVALTETDAFGFLVETVVYQQLSGASARAIFARLEAQVGLTPGRIARASDAQLRALGLSSGKMRTIRTLAAAVEKGSVDLAALSRARDEEVGRVICGMPGFGPWSAEMFLIFHLQRLDVWPVGDLALRRAIARQLNQGRPVDPRSAGPLGERFRPYRTIATWYLWADDHAQGVGEA